MAEGELRDDDEFSQLEAAGDDLLAELGEVYLYVRPIFLIGPCRRRREIWPEVEQAARNCIAVHCDVLPGRHPQVGPVKFLAGGRRLNGELDGLGGLRGNGSGWDRWLRCNRYRDRFSCAES